MYKRGKRGKRVPKVKKIYDGYEWDSALELEYYKLLHELEIKIVSRQEKFLIKDRFHYTDAFGKKRVLGDITYKPDFIIDVGLDKLVAVEVKGYARPLYQLRKKLFIQVYSDKYYFIELNGKVTKSRGREMNEGIELLKRLKELGI